MTTGSRPRSVPTLPERAEVETRGEQHEARQHGPGPAVVLVREAERAGGAGHAAYDGEHAKRDAGESDQGQQGKQVPHRSLITMERGASATCRCAWMKSWSAPLGKVPARRGQSPPASAIACAAPASRAVTTDG